MGYFFEFDAVNNILRISWQGQLTDQILLEGYSAAGRAAASRPACKGINDFSGVTAFDISNGTIERLAKMPSVLEKTAMLIIVAPKDVIFGLSRMFAVLGEGSRSNLHVARTMEEAYGLLGARSPEFSRISVP